MLTVLFDGIAAGTLLFVLAVGLSVTMGLMNFVNLAHGAFAMLGGYVAVILLNRHGVPFLICLPIAFLAAAAAGLVLERTLYRRLYRSSHLDQVLFTIGLVFASTAAADYFMTSLTQVIRLPEFLTGRIRVLGVMDVGTYRLFLIVMCGLCAWALHAMLLRTRFGSRLRAAVDNPRMARGLGINVDRVFVITFALGSGLAGLGGALSIEILGLDPTFPVKYMVYFLIVVALGGTGSIGGPLVASLLLGISDVAGKYYLPEVGAFIIYTVMVVMLIVRPQGLFGRGAVR